MIRLIIPGVILDVLGVEMLLSYVQGLKDPRTNRPSSTAGAISRHRVNDSKNAYCHNIIMLFSTYSHIVNVYRLPLPLPRPRESPLPLDPPLPPPLDPPLNPPSNLPPLLPLCLLSDPLPLPLLNDESEPPLDPRAPPRPLLP